MTHSQGKPVRCVKRFKILFAEQKFEHARDLFFLSATVTDDQTPPAPLLPFTFGPVTATNSKDGAIVGGFLAGLGVDVAILPNMFMRAEWEYIAFAPVNGIRANINTGRVGAGLKF